MPFNYVSVTMSKMRLVAVTKPVEGLPEFSEADGAEELIAFCARVSNPSNQSNHETAAKLLDYCIRHKHWSVFEMANVVCEVETTRDISRQILRHRSFSFQEFSQRYAEVTPEMFKVDHEARTQDESNRQTSTSVDDPELQKAWEEIQQASVDTGVALYHDALSRGIAKELARKVLPEGLTLSRMYMNGTVRSWLHYAEVRIANGTQKEHSEIAEQCREILSSLFPSTSAK